MISMMRKGCLVACAVIMTGLLVLGAAVADNVGRPGQSAQTTGDSRQQAIGSSERLRGLMTERYEVLKSMVESLEKLAAAGRVSLAEWRDAHVAMYAARADLCTDAAARIKVYEDMVDFLRTAEQQAKRRADNGRITEAEFMQARLATIEAEIALERLRLGRTR